MAITGLGMNVSDLVSQLMSIERQPLTKMQASSTKITNQISDLGRFSSDLSNLKTTMQAMTSSSFLNSNKIESSDSSVLGVKADSTAAASRYDLNITQLASSKSMTYTVAAADSTSAITGLSGEISVNGKTVNLGASDVSLSSFVSSVNNAKTGVTAAAVKDGATGNYKVVFMGQTTGATAADFSISNVSGSAFATLGTSSDIQGKDANYTINGVSLTSSSNKIEDVVSGVTLSLNKVGSAAATVSKDEEAVTKKVSDFVSAYNAIDSSVDSLRQSNFKGDNMLVSVQRQLYDSINQPYASSVNGKTATNGAPLTLMGIQLDSGGKLKLDEAAFKKVLAADPNGMATMLQNGPGKSLIDKVNELVDSGGLIDSRKSSLNSSKKMLESRQATMQAMLDRKQASLIAQFSALDASLGKMQASLDGVKSALGI